MFKRLFCALFALILLCSVPVSATETENGAPALHSAAAIVYSLNSKDVILEKNADLSLAPASLTKITTAMTVLELCPDPDNTYVTVPDANLFEEIRAVGGSNIDLTVGECLTVTDLLYAVMLPSACDACNVLAWHFSNGNLSAFADRMTDWARRAGAENTLFCNAHGLDAPGHRSTARDTAKIILKALENERFVEIINTFEHLIPENDFHQKRYVSYQSTIPMLWYNSGEYYRGMTGIKSGYTLEAKCCLSSMAKRDNEAFLVVCMGAEKENGTNHARTDTAALYDWAFANFETRTLCRAGESLGTVSLTGATEAQEDVILREDLLVCARKDAGDVTYSMDVPTASAAAPFSEVAGTLSVTQNGTLLATRTLYYQETPVAAPPAAAPEEPEKGAPLSPVAIVGIVLLSLLFLTVLAFLWLLRPQKKKRRAPVRRPSPATQVRTPAPRPKESAHRAPASAQRRPSSPARRPAPPVQKRPPQNTGRRQG